LPIYKPAMIEMLLYIAAQCLRCLTFCPVNLCSVPAGTYVSHWWRLAKLLTCTGKLYSWAYLSLHNKAQCQKFSVICLCISQLYFMFLRLPEDITIYILVICCIADLMRNFIWMSMKSTTIIST